MLKAESMEGGFNSQTTYVCIILQNKNHKLHTYAKKKNMAKSNTFLHTQKKCAGIYFRAHLDAMWLTRNPGNL